MIVNLAQATDSKQYGGKAASLSMLIENGFNVPDAFVVSASEAKPVSTALRNALLKEFDDLQSGYVSVRSSAINEDGVNAAWAGQLDTFLNCSREDFIDYVYKCQQSAQSERAKYYALLNGASAGKVAVIVQKMIQSDVSGVAFSIDPVSHNTSKVVIEAGYGLGEAIVSGDITPDSYVYDKSSKEITDIIISTQIKKLEIGEYGKNKWTENIENADKQKLTNSQIVSLAEEILTLEKLRGYPVDVEWGIAKGTIYFLQCRPVTAIA